MDTQDPFVAYYRKELDSLRRAGSLFAERYPKLAGEMKLGSSSAGDPHVERLIESFAYLTAVLQKRIDDRFPEITSALLGVLYPHLTQPVPPMTIVQCKPDPKAGKKSLGYPLPRETKLLSESIAGNQCRFQTCYDTVLWPLDVTDASILRPSAFDFLDRHPAVQSVLRVRLRPQAGFTMKDFQPQLKTLRFFLNGEAQFTGMLYELLLGRTLRVAFFDEASGKAVMAPRDAITAVGWADDETAIPFPLQSHPAYRLLQEYFILPEKFLFLDVHRIGLNPSAAGLDLLFLLDTSPREQITVSSQNFLLGCTPAINLFSRTSEPIRVDQRRSEYRLISDARRERTTEIQSITAVIASASPQDSGALMQPFYDFASDAHPGSAFWYSRRTEVQDGILEGTNTFLSFVDLAFNPKLPPSQTVYAQLLCTNRTLARQMMEGSLLTTEDPAPLSSVTCLMRPTVTAYPPLGGSSRWALISNLVLNHLSLDNGPESLNALKKMLRLYSLLDLPEVTRQIEGVVKLEKRTIMRHVGRGWQGWAQGTQIHLTFDESAFSGASMYLFGSVLRQVFALYGSINSFSELVVGTKSKKMIHHYPPLSCEQPHL